MTSRARICDYCTVRMSRDETKHHKFIDGNAEYCTCSKECKKKMKECLASPSKIKLKPGRWHSHNYTMRSSLIVGRGKV